MVKTDQGLRDWVIQRLSAIVMAVYSLGLIFYFLCHPELSFADWHGLFAQTWVKVFTMVFLLSLMMHAWLGIWTIFTDYVKCFVIRSILNALVLLMLAACFFWGLIIISWSV
ncbi:MAG TPA: succinate dehydrogenase, hydrophobic membrane anchor protein [Gammaproteobacteria bacterium]|nr:succinate dehydrogenase, hydrophobic membrane anchor protein [Gammaproteobacteria bacterium]